MLAPKQPEQPHEACQEFGCSHTLLICVLAQRSKCKEDVFHMQAL